MNVKMLPDKSQALKKWVVVKSEFWRQALRF